MNLGRFALGGQMQIVMCEWETGAKMGLGSRKGQGHTFVSSAVTWLPREELLRTYLPIHTARYQPESNGFYLIP